MGNLVPEKYQNQWGGGEGGWHLSFDKVSSQGNNSLISHLEIT